MCPGKILPVTTLLGQSRLKYKAKATNLAFLCKQAETQHRRLQWIVLGLVFGIVLFGLPSWMLIGWIIQALILMLLFSVLGGAPRPS